MKEITSKKFKKGTFVKVMIMSDNGRIYDINHKSIKDFTYLHSYFPVITNEDIAIKIFNERNLKKEGNSLYEITGYSYFNFDGSGIKKYFHRKHYFFGKIDEGIYKGKVEYERKLTIKEVILDYPKKIKELEEILFA